jgi:hypothetical protein
VYFCFACSPHVLPDGLKDVLQGRHTLELVQLSVCPLFYSSERSVRYKKTTLERVKSSGVVALYLKYCNVIIITLQYLYCNCTTIHLKARASSIRRSSVHFLSSFFFIQKRKTMDTQCACSTRDKKKAPCSTRDKKKASWSTRPCTKRHGAAA